MKWIWIWAKEIQLYIQNYHGTWLGDRFDVVVSACYLHDKGRAKSISVLQIQNLSFWRSFPLQLERRFLLLLDNPHQTAWPIPWMMLIAQARAKVNPKVGGGSQADVLKAYAWNYQKFCMQKDWPVRSSIRGLFFERRHFCQFQSVLIYIHQCLLRS